MTSSAPDTTAARRRRGFIFMLLSVVLVATGFQVTRAALRDSTPLTVNLLHNITTFACFLLLGGLWRRAGWTVAEIGTVSWSTLGAFLRANARLFVPAPFLLALNGWLMNTSMSLYGAEMTAFLANLTFVFLVIAGWIAGERTKAGEAAAIVVMISGAFLFSYHGDAVAWGAIGLMTTACAIIAGKQLLVKHVSSYSPLPLAMCAVMGLSLPWTAGLLVITRQGQWPSPRTLFLTMAAAVLTSVAGMTLLYRAYHLVGVSRGAPFNTLRPLVVLLIGLGLGHAAPTLLQMVGGALILGGSLALTLRR